MKFEIIQSDSGREGMKGYSGVHYFLGLADRLEGSFIYSVDSCTRFVAEMIMDRPGINVDNLTI